MDILRMVVTKRSEDQTKKKDAESLDRFSSRVAKLRGEGPMATSCEPEVTLEVVSINISDIEIPQNYLRKSLGDIDCLAASIKVYGIQQPLKVVKIKGTKKFRLVFGWRRLKAAEKLGMDAVPCIVELVTREDRMQILSLMENMHRSSLNPFEVADCYHVLSQATPVEELAKSLGINMELFQQTVELLKLPANLRKEIMRDAERFSVPMLKMLVDLNEQSKVNGKKLLQAMLSGEVNTASEAKAYIARL